MNLSLSYCQRKQKDYYVQVVNIRLILIYSFDLQKEVITRVKYS